MNSKALPIIPIALNFANKRSMQTWVVQSDGMSEQFIIVASILQINVDGDT
jgi:hypothetical protein